MCLIQKLWVYHRSSTSISPIPILILFISLYSFLLQFTYRLLKIKKVLSLHDYYTHFDFDISDLTEILCSLVQRVIPTLQSH